MNPTPEYLADWIALNLTPGLGNVGLRKLLTEFGSPSAIVSASINALTQYIKPEVAHHLLHERDAKKIEETLSWLDKSENYLITLADPHYPQLLLEIPDPPAILYYKGNPALLNSLSLAIVGSRSATAQGIVNAENFAHVLSDAGLCIVSGMALGIDAAAHRGGLIGRSSSIAVVGTGLDKIYPARNKDLAHLLAEKGGLLSEFPLGTPPLANNFPKRNRLISGLTRGCLIVEAAIESGSLITAHQAIEQGREVFAIPGSIHSPHTKGCHRLIKQGAKLVESAQDILEEFSALHQHTVFKENAVNLISNQEKILLDHLGFDPIDIDTLCIRSGLDSKEVCATLLRLELNNIITTLPGGRYQRLN